MHSQSGSPDEATALVQHLFKGSWKVDHPFREEAKKPQEQSEAQQGKVEPSEDSGEDRQDPKSEEKQEEKHESKQEGA